MPFAPCRPGRPPMYKEYQAEKLCQAYEAVKGGQSVRRAAEQFGIPKSTLGDRITGRVKFDSHSGPPRYLSNTEEDELASFICQCAGMGYAKTKKEILAIVQAVLATKGNHVNLSNGWWESFKSRHPYLTLRAVEKLSYSRFVASNSIIINNYFDLLEQTLEDNDILENPSQIFNCDETGMPLDHTPGSVIGIRGQKHPRAIVSGVKKQITVLACANAAGNVIPPLVLFSRKALNPQLTIGEVPGTMYGLNDSGWMDSEIFHNWFTHHFLVHVPAARPLLLLLDGHSTHYNPAFVRRAAEEKVIVFCLPPNTTHLTQPLDKGIFGPLKTYWHQECQTFMGQNPGKVVTQYNFSALFSKAWYRSMTIPNAMAAFHTTGIYPFNRSAIQVMDNTPPVNDQRSLCAKTGLAFIPLYSPARSERSERSEHLTKRHTETQFTEDEIARFTLRYEEGYDIASDDRYNTWLAQYDSAAPSNSSRSNLLLGEGWNSRSILRAVTQLPEPPIVRSLSYEDKCGKVLTSVENRKIIEEKQRQKQQKQREKEERKEERLRKRAEKLAEQERKKKERKKPPKKPLLTSTVSTGDSSYSSDTEAEADLADLFDDDHISDFGRQNHFCMVFVVAVCCCLLEINPMSCVTLSFCARYSLTSHSPLKKLLSFAPTMHHNDNYPPLICVY